jgi:CheY-like chemotaxis protein
MTTHGTTVRIFLVEDNAPDVILIREALHAQNISYQLQCCEDGEQAIRALSDAETSLVPDLIVLDLNLPRIDGFDVLRWVRSEPALSHVPVAILTSSQSAQDRQLAKNLGATAFISKPPNLADFLTKVGSALVELLPRGRRDPKGGAEYCQPRRSCSRSLPIRLLRQAGRSPRQSLRESSLRLRVWSRTGRSGNQPAIFRALPGTARIPADCCRTSRAGF